MKVKTKILCMCLVAVLLVGIIPLNSFAASNQGSNQSYNVGSSLHNIEDNTGYYLSEQNKASALSSGHNKIGDLKITGDMRKTTWNGYEAYAVKGGSITFEYKQTWANQNSGGHYWELSEDTETHISGQGVGEIGDGAILIMKSTNGGASWVKTGASSVDVDGERITFTPPANEIKQGVLYKFIAVCEAYYSYTYQSGTKKVYPSYWDAPWYIHAFSGPAGVGVWVLANGWDEPVYDTARHYENFAQQSIVYVASDSAEVGFYSTATDAKDISKEFGDVSTETLEILKKGLSLTDGSVSFKQIKVDKLGNTSFNVTCSYNGGAYTSVSDGTVYKKPGHYRFKVRTSFGTEKITNLYIMDLGNDFGYSQYFGGGFVSQDKRVFSKDSPFPCYMVGTTLNVSPKNCLPGLYGSIYHYEDGKAIENNAYETVKSFAGQKSACTLTLDKVGIYCADLYSSNPSACGEVVYYTFYFVVVDDPEYAPKINKELLFSADRPTSVKTKNYSVNFQTAGGGSYIFVFDATEEGYKKALEFSESIEYRYIEEFTDKNGKKYYYYKGHGTSGLKERFDSKVEMYAALSQYAVDNVNVAYINNTEAYAVMSFDEALKNIENTSIKNDVRVCISDEVRSSLVAEDIILNGYRFYQAAEYECSRVTATGEDGNVYEIPFDTPVEQVLKRTGRYLITEYNWNSTTSYYGVVFENNSVTGEIGYTLTKDFVEDNGVISSSTSDVILANSITLTGGHDRYDSQALVEITGVGYRQVMLLSELDGFVLDELGKYTVSIINRCAYKHSVEIEIVEISKVQVYFEGYEDSNLTIELGEELGDRLPDVEKVGYVFVGWFDNGNMVDGSTSYKEIKKVVLKPVFEAKDVTIMFNSFGKTEMQTVKFDSEIQLPAAEGIEGFEFVGWELDGECIDTLNVSTEGTIVLVAKYEKQQPISSILSIITSKLLLPYGAIAAMASVATLI